MKIASVDQYFPRRRTRLVKVTTDTGIVGWGETTLEGKPKSTVAAVEEMAEYLVGKDPLRIEHHWQHIYRSAFYRGGNVLMTALSGIDQALWDIKGKHYAAPIYELLGGAVRDRIRIYAHWGIRSMDERSLSHARQRLETLQERGYTAYKAGPGGKWRAHEPPAMVDEFVKRAYTMREWVGPDIELAFDFHGKMTPAMAIEVCDQLKGMRPMFVEEPVPQENVDALKLVSDHVPFPIATGERFLTRWGFRECLERGRPRSSNRTPRTLVGSANSGGSPRWRRSTTSTCSRIARLAPWRSPHAYRSTPRLPTSLRRNRSRPV